MATRKKILTIEEQIMAEAEVSANRNNLIRKDYMKGNPNNAREGSVELEVEAAKALLNGAFFKNWFKETI